MPERTLTTRVENLERSVELLEALPARVSAVEWQIRQLRTEMGEQFSAIRQEFAAADSGLREEFRTLRTDLRAELRAEGEAIRTELRAEIKAEGEAVRTELRAEIKAEGEVIRTELRKEIRDGDGETRRLHAGAARRGPVADGKHPGRSAPPTQTVKSAIPGFSWP